MWTLGNSESNHLGGVVELTKSPSGSSKAKQHPNNLQQAMHNDDVARVLPIDKDVIEKNCNSTILHFVKMMNIHMHIYRKYPY